MRCKQGQQARIIQSIDGISVGLIVTCVSYDGDHSQYGPIWKVASDVEMVSEYGAVGRNMHVPDEWLEPIVDNIDDKHYNKEMEKVE